MFGGNRDAKNALASHRMAAGAPIGEEMARAVPLAIFERNSMGIVFTPKGRLKSGKLHTVGFLGVLLCFCNLSDHAGVHRLYPLSCAFAWHWLLTKLPAVSHPCTITESGEEAHSDLARW